MILWTHYRMSTHAPLPWSSTWSHTKLLMIRLSPPCPMCRASKPKMILDKAHPRRILALKVKCKKRDSGCTWTGEVYDLFEHVNKKCKYAEKGITAWGCGQITILICPDRMTLEQWTVCSIMKAYTLPSNHKYM